MHWITLEVDVGVLMIGYGGWPLICSWAWNEHSKEHRYNSMYLAEIHILAFILAQIMSPYKYTISSWYFGSWYSGRAGNSVPEFAKSCLKVVRANTPATSHQTTSLSNHQPFTTTSISPLSFLPLHGGEHLRFRTVWQSLTWGFANGSLAETDLCGVSRKTQTRYLLKAPW